MKYVPFVLAGTAATVIASAVSVYVHPTWGRSEPAPAPVVPVKALPFADKTLAAVDQLKGQLYRRFTDRQNVDFGMSRVIRENARLHEGPLASFHTRSGRPKTKAGADGRTMIQIDGEWISSSDIRRTMTPENKIETDAITTLLAGDADVSIYTIGRLNLDDGRPISDDEAPSSFFYNGGPGGRGIRVRGPAYLSQHGPKAPLPSELVAFGRKAWRLGGEDFDAPGPNGWHFFARRVPITDESCTNCHSRDIEGHLPMNAGDQVGLFVIGLKLKRS